MSRKRIIGIVVLAVLVVALTVGVKAFTSPGAPGGMPEHITVAQARGDTAGQVVKVGGDVVPGSISWDNASRLLRFTLAGEGDRMAVVYRGPAPNDFKPAGALVVEGIYTNGAFEAISITTRSSPLCKACHG